MWFQRAKVNILIIRKLLMLIKQMKHEWIYIYIYFCTFLPSFRGLGIDFSVPAWMKQTQLSMRPWTGGQVISEGFSDIAISNIWRDWNNTCSLFTLLHSLSTRLLMCRSNCDALIINFYSLWNVQSLFCTCSVGEQRI